MTMLTPNHQKFCLEYVATGNAAEAYRRAYNPKILQPDNAPLQKPRSPGQGPHQGHRRSSASGGAGTLERKLSDDNDRVTRELVCLVFFDIGRVFDEDGALRKVSDINEDTRAAIADIEVVTRDVDRGADRPLADVQCFKLADKLGALDKIAKMLGGCTSKIANSARPGIYKRQAAFT